MALTHKDVAEILKIIDESDVDELVIENDGFKITIVRSIGEGGARVEAVAEAAAEGVGSPVPAKPAPRAAAARKRSGMVEVTTPMSGIFYRKPSPEEPPFVELGDKVEQGDALCLIEVMKLFTTIEAPAAGEIVEIAVDDAGPVEQDAVLFVIAAA